MGPDAVVVGGGGRGGVMMGCRQRVGWMGIPFLQQVQNILALYVNYRDADCSALPFSVHLCNSCSAGRVSE